MRNRKCIETNIPEIDVRRMYQRIADDSSYFETDDNGTIIRIVEDEGHHAFIRYLVKIEDFIADVLSSNEPAFRLELDKFGTMLLKKLPLGQYFKSAYDFSSTYSSEYDYSAHVDLFFNCWKASALHNEGFNNPRGHSSKPDKKQFEVFNDFLHFIRTEASTPEFRKRMGRMNENYINNYSSAVEYIDALFEHCCSKLLVLRIDLAYRHDVAKHITAEQAKADLEHFLNNRRGNHKLFKHWAGYIRKLEWGPEKGLHFHLIVFYKGSKRCQDIYLAKALGEYWKKITDNRGIYWNCNANKDDYWRLGIGMVNINDVGKRKVLTEDVVSYLVKSEQSLRAKKLGEGKCFARGIMPKLNHYPITISEPLRSSELHIADSFYGTYSE
jgi:hypothetical protein